MIAEKRMAVIYKATFAAYCVAWGRWVEAENNLHKFGLVLTSPKGFLIQSPYVSIAHRSWSQMMKAISELGISPTSQARVSRLEAPGEEDAFARFDGKLKVVR